MDCKFSGTPRQKKEKSSVLVLKEYWRTNMGRPKKVVKKWNPLYSKTSVRMVLQNTLSKSNYGDMSINEKNFIKEVLEECDRIYMRKQEQEK